jgi:subtilisin-like proprotein convertase family protein
MRNSFVAVCLIIVAASPGVTAFETSVVDPSSVVGVEIAAEIHPDDPATVTCTIHWLRDSNDARIGLRGPVSLLKSTAPGSWNQASDRWDSRSLPVAAGDRTELVLSLADSIVGSPIVLFAERSEDDVSLQASVVLSSNGSRTTATPQVNLKLRHEVIDETHGAVVIDSLGLPAGPKAQVFAEDPTNLAIADGPTDCSPSSSTWPLTTFIGVSSAPGSATATAVEVHVTVVHAEMSDLQIVFSKEFGTVAKFLWQNDSGVNLDQTFTTDRFGSTLPGVGQPVNGAWVLALRDCFAGDTGILDYWSVRIDYAGSATIDLVADSVSLDSATVAAGDPVEVDWSGRVAGSGSVGGLFKTGFYLSTDTAITTGDIYLGLEPITGATNPGDTFGQSSPGKTVTIPGGTPDGTYYLGIIVDADLDVDESDETNNTAWAALTVGSGGGSSCLYNQSELSLWNGRFRITGASWRNGVPANFFLQNICPNGDPSQTSAAFYFNAAWPPVEEGFVSIRDECSGTRNAYIVEIACASTRRFYVDITDTWTMTTHRYENPTGGSSVCFPADATSFAGSCP